MGFIALGLAIVAFPALLKGTSALAKARTARRLYDFEAFKDRFFLTFTACSCATFLGYIVPYFYIAAFAQDVLGITRTYATYILIMGISGSFFGRLFAGAMAQRLGSIFTWCCCAASSGILSLSWIAINSEAGIITFSVLWGFISGGLVTLPAAVFPRLCPDLKRLGTRTGMSWGISSFASLIGSPIAGAMLGHHDANESRQQARRNYLGPQLWSGCCLLVGAGIIFTLLLQCRRRDKTSFFI